jgi:hypothetical protein
MRDSVYALAFTTIFCLCSVVGRAADLPSIALEQDYSAHRATSSDPTGGNADYKPLPPGETLTMAELQGPGMIQHCWFTIGTDYERFLSDLVLKITWDDAEQPAVEAPLGPFFGIGHDHCVDVVSHAIVVMASRAPYIKDPPGRAAFNCYFPMPFRKRAVVTLTNTSDHGIGRVYYHIDYQRYDQLPPEAMYFHARYRSEKTEPGMSDNRLNTSGKENYVILDTAGRGHYVGCTLHVEAHQYEPGKWYEGDELIVVDGQHDNAIRGTGSEDYFNMAWGARRWFQSPWFGTSYHAWNEGELELAHYGRFSLYRWHLKDPIPFRNSIHVSIEHGHDNDAANQYASVAYWYADKP